MSPRILEFTGQAFTGKHARFPKRPNQSRERGAAGQREHQQANTELALVLTRALPAHQPWRTSWLAQPGTRKLGAPGSLKFEQSKPGTWRGLVAIRKKINSRIRIEYEPRPGPRWLWFSLLRRVRACRAKLAYPIVGPLLFVPG